MALLMENTVPRNYLPLIERMKFFIEPDISCSRFFGMACFSERSIGKYRITGEIKDLELTEMGTFIAHHINNGLFIDIPCGQFEARESAIDFDTTALASALGVKTYWEIDIDADVIGNRIPQSIDVIERGSYRLAEKIGPMGTHTENDIDIVTVQDDLLGFISKMPASPSPKAIYISAIQPEADFMKDSNNHRDVAVPYLHALYDELDRVCSGKDLLIINSSAMLIEGIDESVFPDIHPALALPQKGFSLMRRCAFDKVHVFKKYN
jgi:hypothetical protein